MPEYEYRIVTFSRANAGEDVRRMLTEYAEYGHWELHRTTLFMGGWRRTTLRRKIIRAVRPS